MPMTKTLFLAATAAIALGASAGAQVTPPTPQQPMQHPTPPGNVPLRNDVTPPAAGFISEADLRSTLERQGYSQVTGLRIEGSNYIARAMRGQSGFVLIVEGATGRVLSSEPG